MAATKIIKQPFDDSSVDVTGNRETWYYLVKVDSISDTPIVARDAVIMDGETVVAAVPGYMSGHPTNPLMRVTSKTAARLDKARLWFKVTVVFSVPEFAAFETKPTGTDVKWNKSVTVNGVEVVEGVNRDRNKKPITNSFGDPYSAEVNRVLYDEEIVIEFDCDIVNMSAIAAARGTVNTASVTLNITTQLGLTFNRTFPAWTLKVGNCTYGNQIGPDGAGAWHVTLPLLYRSQLDQAGVEIGWKRQLVDKGLRWWNGTTHDSAHTVVAKDGVERLLNGSGELLASGADAVMRVIEMETPAAFTTLLSGI